MTDHLEPTLEADPLLTSLPVENNTNRAWALVKEKYVFGRHLACDVNINGATTDKAPVNDLNIEKAERCFRREADILRTIDHPCIIQFYDFFETKSAYYIFLELALDGSLFDHIINQGKLSERESLFFFYQMLTAVDHLHRLGITHRDLKPENILLEKTSSGDFLYKITDFGLAKIVGETSYMKTLCGTPGYVAPEVIFRGARSEQYTNVVDCWSLGVILYICLVGYPPFCEDPQIREEQVLTGHLYYNEEDWEGLSPKVFDLIQKLLRVDPKSRFTITQALNHEWMLVVLSINIYFIYVLKIYYFFTYRC
ncbi:hypothetical protein Zmor_016345 [Zophobas morio]|uniref:Protein kinase domain-containing protein n=1 Tax=Zophobas morio TaxID=2755281 RepID=A0AA38HHQ3_9CUCU|nr:hypothetical protein Zmor_016345 [Zophobas morio]